MNFKQVMHPVRSVAQDLHVMPNSGFSEGVSDHVVNVYLLKAEVGETDYMSSNLDQAV